MEDKDLFQQVVALVVRTRQAIISASCRLWSAFRAIELEQIVTSSQNSNQNDRELEFRLKQNTIQAGPPYL